MVWRKLFQPSALRALQSFFAAVVVAAAVVVVDVVWESWKVKAQVHARIYNLRYRA